MKVKKYLPILEKIELINNIVELSFKDEDGKRVYDSVLKEIAYVYYVAKYYSDVEMTKDESEETDILLSYDMLVEKGIIHDIYLEIPKSELDFIKRNIEESIYNIKEEIKNQNSFIEIIKNILVDFQSNLPMMADAIKNFSPENFEKLNELVKFSKGE
jgi:hypothetical protein